MKYVVKHGMDDLARVRAVIDRAYEAYRAKLANHDPALTWNGENHAVVSFRVMKKTLEAKFMIDSDEVRIEGDIPFLFRPFQKTIEKVVGGEVEKWMAKARNGDL